MTNAIGTGTANLSINIPLDEKQQWGRLAFTLGQSQGELVRRLTLKGLEAELADCEGKIYREIGFVNRDGEVALLKQAEAIRQTIESIKSTRRQYYGAACALVCLVAFTAALISGHQDIRRAGRRVRTDRVEEVEEITA